MLAKLTFLGAARNVTGSSYLLETHDTRVLVDCGLYQERKHQERNWQPFQFNPESIDADILTGILEMNKEEAVEILGELADFSILEKRKDAYSIHRLRQEAARELDENQSLGRKTTKYLNDITKLVLEKGAYREAYHIIPHLVHLGSMFGDDLELDEFPSCGLLSQFAEYLYRAGYFILRMGDVRAERA